MGWDLASTGSAVGGVASREGEGDDCAAPAGAARPPWGWSWRWVRTTNLDGGQTARHGPAHSRLVHTCSEWSRL